MESTEKKKVEKQDLRKNPDKYFVKPFNPETHERVWVTFLNGTAGWVERRRK